MQTKTTPHPIGANRFVAYFVPPYATVGMPVLIVEATNIGTKKRPHWRYRSDEGFWFDHDALTDVDPLEGSR